MCSGKTYKIKIFIIYAWHLRGMKLEEPVIHISGRENTYKILVGRLLDKYLDLNGRL